MRTIAAAGLGLMLVFTAGACSSDGEVDAGNVEGKMVDQLTAGEGFDEDEARCIAAAVKDDMGADRLAELYRDDPQDLPAEVQDAVLEQTPGCFDMGSIVESIPQ